MIYGDGGNSDPKALALWFVKTSFREKKKFTFLFRENAVLSENEVFSFPHPSLTVSRVRTMQEASKKKIYFLFRADAHRVAIYVVNRVVPHPQPSKITPSPEGPFLRKFRSVCLLRLLIHRLPAHKFEPPAAIAITSKYTHGSTSPYSRQYKTTSHRPLDLESA